MMPPGAAAGGHVLAADVGGTKTAIALAQAGIARRIIVQRVYPSQRYAGLESIVAEFLAEARRALPGATLDAACFALAGPVVDDAGTLTNLGWKVESGALARRFGIPRVLLVNDFAAAGRGIEYLGPADLATLQPGEPFERGVRLVIGAGTGLGTSVITWQGAGYAVHASEGGHADFAPVDEAQDQLLLHLRREFGRVSYERVVSGPGLMAIFNFLTASGSAPSQALTDAMKDRGHAAEVISAFGAEGRDPVAARAFDIFLTAYGAYAGNMALAVLARGGVFLAGGIAPKIATRLKDGIFMRAFTDKGRFEGLLGTIPVHIVMNPEVGLYGAVLEAANALGAAGA